MEDFTKWESQLRGRGFSKNLKIVANTKDMPEEEWLEHRKKGFGGSDAAKILGRSRFGTAFSTWLDKTGLKGRGEATESMELGHFFEGPIADLFKERTGLTVMKVNALLSNPEEAPNLLANLDRIYKMENGEWAILEIKNLNGHWTEAQIRNEYIPQVTQYMLVTGLRHATLFGTVGGTRTEQIDISWDEVESEAKELVRKAAILKVCVDEMNPPKLESEEWFNQAGDTWMKEAQEYKDGSAEKEDIHLQGIKGLALNRMNALKAEIKEKTAEMEACKATLVDGVNTPAVFHYEDSKVTYRYQSGSTSVDSKKLREEFPKVFEQVSKTGKGFWVVK